MVWHIAAVAAPVCLLDRMRPQPPLLCPMCVTKDTELVLEFRISHTPRNPPSYALRFAFSLTHARVRRPAAGQPSAVAGRGRVYIH